MLKNQRYILIITTVKQMIQVIQVVMKMIIPVEEVSLLEEEIVLSW
jgi:hypothetical protein